MNDQGIKGENNHPYRKRWVIDVIAINYLLYAREIAPVRAGRCDHTFKKFQKRKGISDENN